jgi:hypothetical protein
VRTREGCLSVCQLVLNCCVWKTKCATIVSRFACYCPCLRATNRRRRANERVSEEWGEGGGGEQKTERVRYKKRKETNRKERMVD